MPYKYGKSTRQSWLFKNNYSTRAYWRQDNYSQLAAAHFVA